MNTTFNLSKHITKFASNIFLKTGKEQITFQTFYNQVIFTSYKLKKLGIKKESIVIVNNISMESFPVLLFALWLNKAIVFPVNPKFTKFQIEKIIKETKAHIYISDKTHSLNLSTSKHIKPNDILDSTSESTSIPDVELGHENTATIILTSGSSGDPKYVVHSLANHIYSATAVNEYFNLSDQDNWLLTLPIFHVAGLAIIMRTFLAGATLSVSRDEESINKILQNNMPSHISVVPTQLQRLLKNEECPEMLKKCKSIFLGGSSIPQKLIKEGLNQNLKIFTSYGLTEMSSTVAIKKNEDGQSGQAEVLPIHELKTIDDEILLKGPCLFAGYLEKGTVKNITDPSGWFHSRDLGNLDEQKQLTVFGRKDNMFISGGENIYPEEIEKYLMEIEGVVQAVVIPIEDKEFGSRPVALIQPFKKEQIPKIINELKEILPSFKIPDQFFPFSNESNHGIKIDREKLKQQIRQETKN